MTQALPPGGRWESSVALAPLMLSDHYGASRKATSLQGDVQVHCQVAWGKTPILPADRNRPIQDLLAWQGWAQAVPLTVGF